MIQIFIDERGLKFLTNLRLVLVKICRLSFQLSVAFCLHCKSNTGSYMKCKTGLKLFKFLTYRINFSSTPEDSFCCAIFVIIVYTRQWQCYSCIMLSNGRLNLGYIWSIYSCIQFINEIYSVAYSKPSQTSRIERLLNLIYDQYQMLINAN